MSLGWPTPVVWPSLASAKPAGHTLSSINIFQTWPLYTDSYQIYHCVWTKGCSSAVLHNPPPPLLYTDSYQIFHCVWMKGCSSAVLLNPPPPLLYTDSYQIYHCVWMKVCSSAVLLNPPPPSPPLPPPLHWFISDLPLCLNEGML